MIQGQGNRPSGHRRHWALPPSLAAVVCAALLAGAVIAASAEPAAAEQSSQPGWAAAGGLDVGLFHSCAVVSGGQVRCWGFAADGQLGYGNTRTVGDDESPASVGPVNLGAGQTATAIAAGDFHACALLGSGRVL